MGSEFAQRQALSLEPRSTSCSNQKPVFTCTSLADPGTPLSPVNSTPQSSMGRRVPILGSRKFGNWLPPSSLQPGTTVLPFLKQATFSPNKMCLLCCPPLWNGGAQAEVGTPASFRDGGRRLNARPAPARSYRSCTVYTMSVDDLPAVGLSP